MVRVCFVCLGNICRSPTAEGVMRRLVDEAGLGAVVAVDSAGTSAYHIGDSPDRRSAAAAARHGVKLEGQSRQFVRADFDRFDYVVAMDRDNLSALQRLSRTGGDRERLSLMRDHETNGTNRRAGTGPNAGSGPNAGPGYSADVPDPYYGSGDGFERVFQICKRSCVGLLAGIRTQHGV